MEELKEQEQRRPGCRASSCSINSSSEGSQSASDESESPSRDNPPLNEKLDGTTLADPRRKAQVCQYPNSMLRSRRMMKEIHAALLIKDNLSEEKTDKNGSERNLPSTLMMSSRPPYDCDTDLGVRNDGSNGCLYVKI